MIFNTTIYKAGEGGGAGTELVVPAIGSTQTAEVNTKVLLVYANEVGGTAIPVEDNTANGTGDRGRNQYGSTFAEPTWYNNDGKGNYCELSSNNEGLTATWNLGNSNNPWSFWDTDPSIIVSSDWWYPRTAIGFGSAGAFVEKYSTGTSNSNISAFHGVVGGFVATHQRYDYARTPWGAVYDSNIHSFYTRSISSGSLFIRYEDHPCLVNLSNNTATVIDGKTNTDLQTISITGSNYNIPTNSIGYPLTPSGDYFVIWSNAGDIGLFRLTKTPSWSVTHLTTLPVNQGGTIQIIRATEDRTSLHCFIVPNSCDDVNNVKHYIVDKETGEVTQGPDLLDSKGYDIILTGAFAPNMSRASFILRNSTTGDLKCAVSGLDTVLPYEYAAVPFNSANLTDSAVTGFVKSQDDTDELGNPIATVEALLDPNATPPSAYRLIGMNVTVNEGEPL